MPSRRDQSIFNLISPQGRDPNKNSSTNLFLAKLYQTYRLNWRQGRRERKSKFIPGPWSFKRPNFPSRVPIHDTLSNKFLPVIRTVSRRYAIFRCISFGAVCRIAATISLLTFRRNVDDELRAHRLLLSLSRLHEDEIRINSLQMR